MDENTTTAPEDDDLRSSLEEAFEEKAPETEETAESAPEPKEESVASDEKPEKEDENGSLKDEIHEKLSKTPEEGEKKTFKSVEKPNQPPKPDPESDSPTDDRTYSVEKPPVGWKPAVREHWKDLPDDVKQEVVKREREIDDKLRETHQERQFAQQVMQTLRPYEQFFKADGVHPIQSIDNMMSTVAMLRTGTSDQIAQTLSQVVQQYGVGRFGKEFFHKFDQALAGKAPKPEDQQQNALKQQLDQELAPLRQFQQQQLQQQQVAEEQQRNQVKEYLQDFAQKNEFFSDVAQDVAAILQAASQRGKEMDLQQAYEMACNMNPEIKPLLEKRRQAEAAKSQNEVAQKAKKASVSVRGNAPVAGSQQSNGANLRDDIEFAISQLSR